VGGCEGSYFDSALYAIGILERHFIVSAVIDNAGQVVLPEIVRERLGLSPGSVVDFRVDEYGRAFLWKSQDVAERLANLERVVGSLKIDMTTDEVMAMTRGED
jgi:AbrB family looped-hinge helix DNA binding protein